MKKIFIFSALIVASSVAKAQDPSFLNTNQSLVYLNPSFAGSNGHIRNQFSYREQSPNLTGRFITYLNTFDAYIKPLNGGLAVSILTDDQRRGTLKTNLASIAYAQYISVRQGALKIIPSLQVTYGSRVLDRNNLHFGDAIDLRYKSNFWTTGSFPSPTKTYFDFTAGLLVNYKNIYLGGSVFHINQPDIGFSYTRKLPCQLNLHASYNYLVLDKTLLQFSYRFQSQQKFRSNQLMVNGIFYKYLIAGLGWRDESSGLANLGFHASSFNLVIAYEVYTATQPDITSLSTWELHCSININKKKEAEKMLTNFETW